METKYEQLRTRINELLPDRLRLEFGCEVETDKGERATLISYAGEQDWSTYRDADGLIASDEHIGRPKVILGTPLTIEDVLRALHIERSEHWAIEDSGTLVTQTSVEVEGAIDKRFDLTKPLSAPENEEACGAVLKLLK